MHGGRYIHSQLAISEVAMSMPRRSKSPARSALARPAVLDQASCPSDNVTRITGAFPRTLYALHAGDHVSCGTEDIPASSEVPWHSHATSEEVLFCTRGSGKMHIGANTYRFEPGDMAHVPCGVPHRIENTSRKLSLGLTWTLSPPLAPAQFRAGSASDAAGQPWLPRVLPTLFPKKRGAALEAARARVEQLYGTSSRRPPEPTLFHLTCHAMPCSGWRYALHLLVMASMCVCWLASVPLPMKLRCLLVALAYSVAESGFTLLERGRAFTSVAQLAANVLSTPVLEAYHAWLGATPALFVALFPLLIWLYEIILGHVLIWLFGRNIAWCYEDYADAFCTACARLGHGPFWLALGAGFLGLQPALVGASEAAAAGVLA